ncbi:MAG: ABC transporter permease subunit [Anaerolineales bacterium]|nr:ABC transporter permease subunit [Anaerolineales bacterium]
MKLKFKSLWSWIWFLIGTLYFILPLYATLDFSLRMERDTIGFKAYRVAFADPKFVETFARSNILAVITIIVSIILIVPTAYWVRLRLPQARRIVEFITLLPFVIPAIILVFGMIRVFSTPVRIPFTDIILIQPLTTLIVNKFHLGTYILIVAGYMILALPYMYRAVDTGMRTVDVRTLTEASQSLGANGFTIMWHVILPNIRASLLSGALLTYAIVVGEVVLASFLGLDTFGPYLFLLGQHRAYEPSALTFVAFLLTWAAMGIIQLVSGEQGQTAGAH